MIGTLQGFNRTQERVFAYTFFFGRRGPPVD